MYRLSLILSVPGGGSVGFICPFKLYEPNKIAMRRSIVFFISIQLSRKRNHLHRRNTIKLAYKVEGDTGIFLLGHLQRE